MTDLEWQITDINLNERSDLFPQSLMHYIAHGGKKSRLKISSPDTKSRKCRLLCEEIHWNCVSFSLVNRWSQYQRYAGVKCRLLWLFFSGSKYYGTGPTKRSMRKNKCDDCLFSDLPSIYHHAQMHTRPYWLHVQAAQIYQPNLSTPTCVDNSLYIVITTP